MNIEHIIKLFKSNNDSDILIGFTLLSNKYSLEEINKIIKPLRIIKRYNNAYKIPVYIRIFYEDEEWSEWVQIN